MESGFSRHYDGHVDEHKGKRTGGKTGLKKRKAIIFVRRSKEDNEASLQNQIDICYKYCEENGFEVVTIIIEEVSAYNTPIDKRPKMQELFDMALQKKMDVVVCWQQSRLVRSIADQIIVQEVLVEQAGCEVLFADPSEQPFVSNDEFTFLVQMIKGWSNEHEVTELRKRVKQHIRNHQKNGKYVGGTFTGYEWNKHTMRLEQIPDEIEVVKSIFHQYLKEGWSTLQIANWLNKKGVRTKYGKRFYQATVNNILRQKIYCGYYRWGYTTSKRRDKPQPAEGCEVLVTWVDPIITLEEWEQVQLIMQSRSGKKRGQKIIRNNANSLLLTGLIYCETCNRLMGTRNGTSYYSRKDGTTVENKYFRYVCNHPLCKAKTKRYDAEAVDTLVLKEIVKAVSSLDRSVLFERAIRAVEDKKKELYTEQERISHETYQISRERNTLWTNLSNTTDQKLVRMYNEKLLQLEAKEEHLSKRSQQMQEVADQIEVNQTQIDEFMKLIQTLISNDVNSFPIEKKRLYITRLVKNVHLNDDEINLTLLWEEDQAIKEVASL